MDIEPYFKALADPNRIKILAVIVDQPRSMQEIGEATGLPARLVLQQLTFLRSLELIEVHEKAGHELFRFNQRPLFAAMKSLAPKSLSPEVEGDEFDRKVIGDFFENGRIKSIPAQQKKRDAILRFLAQRFETERMYDEREVNKILREYHDDVASWRRYLIDGEFLKRQIIREIETEALMAGNPSVDLRIRYWKE